MFVGGGRRSEERERVSVCDGLRKKKARLNLNWVKKLPTDTVVGGGR